MFVKNISYYNPKERHSLCEFQLDFSSRLLQQKKDNQTIVLICIGTDRATGDCLGPLVGYHLQTRLPSICVFGSLKNPIHAQNLEETLLYIYEHFKDPFIIAVDACLGTKKHVGYVTLSSTPLFPGQGVNRKLPPIGHLSITGIVNTTSPSNRETLQNTRLHLVMELALYISNGLSFCFESLRI